MSDEGWVRLGDCEPGTLVEPVAFGTQWLFTGFVRVDDGTGETHELSGVGTDEVIHLPADALVYPLTAVRLHPSLRGSDLWGLVRRWAAEPGEVTAGVLLDALADHAGRDPDAAAAVRERAAKVAEQEAASMRDERAQTINQPAEWYRCDAAADSADRIVEGIRALGEPEPDGCRVCQGRKLVYLSAAPGTVACPACGGTGEATGEGDR